MTEISATGQTKVFRRAGNADHGERAWLRVEAGPDAGREFQLAGGESVIGRSGENHVVLNDPNVSRRHAAIIHRRGGCRLKDLDSTNGSFINGRGVASRHLRNGDRIGLGRTVMSFNMRGRK